MMEVMRLSELTHPDVYGYLSSIKAIFSVCYMLCSDVMLGMMQLSELTQPDVYGRLNSDFHVIQMHHHMRKMNKVVID